MGPASAGGAPAQEPREEVGDEQMADDALVADTMLEVLLRAMPGKLARGAKGVCGFFIVRGCSRGRCRRRLELYGPPRWRESH